MPKGVFGFRGKPAVCHPLRPNYSFGKCQSCSQKEDYKILPTETKKNQRLKRYGISYTDYLQLLTIQTNSCAICGSESPRQGNNEFFCVDHNHETGVIRGLLCGPCNRGIGYLQDSSELLLKAHNYIREIKK